MSIAPMMRAPSRGLSMDPALRTCSTLETFTTPTLLQHARTPASRLMLSLRQAITNGLGRCLTRAPTQITSRNAQALCSATIRSFSSNDVLQKRLDFIQRPDEAAAKADVVKESAPKSRQKAPRKNAGKTSSLRSVAVEAQRSRTFVMSRGKQRFIDPDAETKVRERWQSLQELD